MRKFLKDRWPSIAKLSLMYGGLTAFWIVLYLKSDSPWWTYVTVSVVEVFFYGLSLKVMYDSYLSDERQRKFMEDIRNG